LVLRGETKLFQMFRSWRIEKAGALTSSTSSTYAYFQTFAPTITNERDETQTILLELRYSKTLISSKAFV
jgi:hypothetical protein